MSSSRTPPMGGERGNSLEGEERMAETEIRDVQPGERVTAYYPYKVGVADHADCERGDDIVRRANESPTGAVQYGCGVYFATDALYFRWRDQAAHNLESDYPGAYSRSGIVEAR